MSALRALVKNLVKESFYGKRKKKQLIFWQFFSFPIKVMSKLSLIRFLTSALRALVSISLILLLNQSENTTATRVSSSSDWWFWSCEVVNTLGLGIAWAGLKLNLFGCVTKRNSWWTCKRTHVFLWH